MYYTAIHKYGSVTKKKKKKKNGDDTKRFVKISVRLSNKKKKLKINKA